MEPLNQPYAIDVRDVEVAYPGARSRALDGVRFQFDGRSLGLLGPNGAGKSTLVKTLLGLIRPGSGRASILGLDVVRSRLEIRRRVGYVPERDCHVPELTAIEYVVLGGELAGMSRSDAIQRSHEILHFVGLGEARYRPVDGYSAGMKQRVKLAHALVHDPDMLFLDEPTNGLDPRGRVEFLDMLCELRAESGVRIVLSSHLLRDVEFVCDEVVVMKTGRVVGRGSVEEMKRVGALRWRVVIRGEADVWTQRLRDRGADVEVLSRDEVVIELPEGLAPELILADSVGTDCRIREFQRYERSMEDVFLEAVRGVPDGEAPCPSTN